MKQLHNPLKSAIRSALQPRGYRFVKGQWIREGDEVIQVVHLDKSPDGEKYYLDVGMFIRSLGLPSSLLERFAHYRVRLCHRLDPEFDELLFVFANAQDIDDVKRERRFQNLLETKGVPLLDRLMSVSGMRECYWTPFERHVYVLRTASPLLFGTDCSP